MMRCAVLCTTLRFIPNLTQAIHKYIIFVQPPRGADHRTAGMELKIFMTILVYLGQLGIHYTGHTYTSIVNTQITHDFKGKSALHATSVGMIF